MQVTSYVPCFGLDSPLAYIQTADPAMQQKQEVMLAQLSLVIFKCANIMSCISEIVRGEQALPDVPALQPPEGDDQGGDAPPRLHGAQARVQGAAALDGRT